MYDPSKPFSIISRPPEHLGVKPPPPHIFPMPVILLLLAEDPAHGYALFKKMCELGVYEEGAEASVVYPSLRVLKEEGLVDTELVDEGAGPPRKVYHITTAGEAMLATMSEHLLRMRKAIDYFEKRYRKTARS
ncbi:MAG: PadR family transcriptional regulator [Candidatus Geothermincolia bacterium]